MRGQNKTPAGVAGVFFGSWLWAVGLGECFPACPDRCAFEEFVCLSAVGELLRFGVPFERGAGEQNADVTECAVTCQGHGVVEV